ncbi:DUF4252 domain-containing protein [Halosquirtibacter laminarini]|uniref:DUF4252 domain-containing protein n=1 Tax=Halosquirtibacter laminarini TaxID=3374600 RepID=A0AC61NC02_9BACT|nr:DUF4252 domain-containing protein [Prolixibacteraceae bacterium]
MKKIILLFLLSCTVLCGYSKERVGEYIKSLSDDQQISKTEIGVEKLRFFASLGDGEDSEWSHAIEKLKYVLILNTPQFPDMQKLNKLIDKDHYKVIAQMSGDTQNRFYIKRKGLFSLGKISNFLMVHTDDSGKDFIVYVECAVSMKDLKKIKESKLISSITQQ